MSNTPSLLPCPFCGSRAMAVVSQHESLWSHDVVDWTRVQCTNEDCNVQTEATCEEYVPSAIDVWNSRPPQPDAAERDAAFEAVRKTLCKLPRFSFLSGGDGAVRRVSDRCGSWIAFDTAHALFDPVAVDAVTNKGTSAAS